MIQGFKNFLMRGDVIVVAVGLVVALAFSTLIQAFTTNIIQPLLAAAGGGASTAGLGPSVNGHLLDFGAFIQAIIYFIIFMAAIYFLVVLPYKAIMKRKGQVVFGDPVPTKTCPACLSDDLPAAASKCKHCGTDQPAGAAA